MNQNDLTKWSEDKLRQALVELDKKNRRHSLWGKEVESEIAWRQHTAMMAKLEAQQ